MPMKLKAQLMDDVTVKRALTRLSYEIIEKSRDLENVVLIGIKTRGVPLAEQIAANIETHTGVKVQTCTLDITFYRDDLTKRHDLPTVNTQTLPVDLNDKEVILVDDVLFTGRTVRAAIDAVFRFGRPARIRLVVLVDRGHRELPIRPDFVGKNIPHLSTRDHRRAFGSCGRQDERGNLRAGREQTGNLRAMTRF